ncbi:hypothetical protein MLD38_037023 [Melastoma candidum]|uniref:Uncharacterized protein n=1 Tax=Melastoma candidum TaxID=119954 RepID=A0ACB9LKT1_9MYRT|nr:hypothetical protein MLD38_037023 [Melastoma candidum]
MTSSKKLSDYMMYLLVKQPKLISAVAGISHIRYEDTCNELKQLGRESGALNIRRFCESILEKQVSEENNQSIIIEPAIKEDNSSDISEPVIEENNPTMKENNLSILNEPAIDENNHTIIIEPAMEGNNHVYSVLRDSCSLVQLLREKDNRWEVIFEVWVELLSYAAGHCRAESHVRLLSQGGEAITIIWMLMALSRIRDRFPLK